MKAAASSSSPARSTDGFEQASTRQQEWAAKFAAGALPPSGTASVLRQTSDDNCGAAAALMAAGSRGKVAGGSDAQRMQELESKFTNGKGTTPAQIARMLAHEGMAVNQAAFKFDQYTVDETLRKGGKVVAMVDSQQITPGAAPGKTGSAHWVVIDGKDAQGRYTVKDPAKGSSYGVDFNHLSNAVDNGWWKHNGGGMLLVGDAPASASGASLATQNANQTVPLAGTPGIGSKGDQFSGRESN